MNIGIKKDLGTWCDMAKQMQRYACKTLYLNKSSTSPHFGMDQHYVLTNIIIRNKPQSTKPISIISLLPPESHNF